MDARSGGLEVLTGLALIVAPSLLGRLLFGSDLNAAGEATGRISLPFAPAGVP